MARTMQEMTHMNVMHYKFLLIHTATHRNTLQHTTCCNTLHAATHTSSTMARMTQEMTHMDVMHCNTLLIHTATHCNSLQHTTHCNTLHAATHYTLQHTRAVPWRG